MNHSRRLVMAFALGALLVPATRLPVAGDRRQVFPRPAAPTEPVEIRGSVAVSNAPTVTVGNAPTVDARQAGKWAVALEGQPIVQVATPPVIVGLETYEFRWSEDRAEVFRVMSIGSGGWVLGEQVGAGSSTQCWLNTQRAISIKRVRP